MRFSLILQVLLAFLSLFVGMARAEGPVLRVGDILTLDLPGENAVSKDFQIDRTGSLQLPEIGAVPVAGLNADEAKQQVRNLLGRVYRDLDRFELRLRERRLLVTVLGFVRQPGPVELPGDATVQMAVIAAGGLTQGAQLDRMQVRRGEQITVFDYKSYLDTGNASLLPTLQALDVVFVPASPLIGNVQVEFDARTLTASGDAAEDRTAVKVFGEVNNPASFAHRHGANVVDMLMRAGGVSRYAAVEQIRIISGAGDPVIFNLKTYLDSGNRGLLPEIGPGATIFVPKEVEEIRTGSLTVFVMGEVFKPGAFESKAGATFLDILASAGGPTRYAETRLIRVLRNDGGVDVVDLRRYTEEPGSIRLPNVGPGDAIFVPEKSDMNEPSWLKISSDRAVRVLGAVGKPGRYEWSDEMTLFDLLAQAGGPTPRGDVANLQILINDGGKSRPVGFNLGKFMREGGNLRDVPVIHAGYTVVVPELPQDPGDNKAQWVRQAPENSIYVMGQVGAPGRYAFNSSMSFLDILTAASGPTSAADLHNVRVSHRSASGKGVSRLDLGRYLETGDETLLPAVLPGDVIYIPERNKFWLDQRKEDTVRVLGAVARPGRYQFGGDMTVLDLLAEAGGPSADAYVERIVVVNFSCCKDQARIFNLIDFAKTGDFSKLPVVRAGDTIYIPNMSRSDWTVFMNGVRDTVSLLSIFALLQGGLF